MAERRSKRNATKSAEYLNIFSKRESKAHTKKVGDILKKCESERTDEEKTLLGNSGEVVKTIEQRARVREKLKLRKQEFEDSPADIESKCKHLSEALKNAKFTVVYTGAGISTAASIPDYRGPNGVWTLLKKGLEPQPVDLSDADPTYTHMAIAKLYTEGLIKYIVSQNCDGLHMRSGMPRNAMSELHGNMYVELCKKCRPVREHIRTFDTTERTGLRKHKTGRLCHSCSGNLTDSIIHFGEKGPFHSPYNWREAAKVADEADVILCLGTSMKVIRRYACLWSMHKPVHERPKLFIVNLQWTPKDDLATLKINGKCDDVMKSVMKNLQLSAPIYQKLQDPIFAYSVPLSKEEIYTVSKKFLIEPEGYQKKTVMNVIKKLSENRVHLELSSDEEEVDILDDIKTESEKPAKQPSTQNVVVAATKSSVIGKGMKNGRRTARKSQSSPVESGIQINCSNSVEHQILKDNLKIKNQESDVKDIKLNNDLVMENGNLEAKIQVNGQNNPVKRRGRHRGRRKVCSKVNTCEEHTKISPNDNKPVSNSKKSQTVALSVKSYNFRSNNSSKNATVTKTVTVVLDGHVVEKYFDKHLSCGMLKRREQYRLEMKSQGKLLPKVKGLNNKSNAKSDKDEKGPCIKIKDCDAGEIASHDVKISSMVNSERQTDSKITSEGSCSDVTTCTRGNRKRTISDEQETNCSKIISKEDVKKRKRKKFDIIDKIYVDSTVRKVHQYISPKDKESSISVDLITPSTSKSLVHSSSKDGQKCDKSCLQSSEKDECLSSINISKKSEKNETKEKCFKSDSEKHTIVDEKCTEAVDCMPSTSQEKDYYVSDTSLSNKPQTRQPTKKIPGSDKLSDSDSLIPNGMPIKGDEALSFLAMEEACELPDLTLDSRKVWACYSSWFTALYQALEEKRDFSGALHRSDINVDSNIVHDPDIVSTAKEQNTVLLANLAVHDLDRQLAKETPSSSICSSMNSSHLILGSSPLSFTNSNLSSPVQFVESGSSAHLSIPSSASAMYQHQNSCSSRLSRDSNSMCSSSMSPRLPPHHGPESQVESQHSTFQQSNTSRRNSQRRHSEMSNQSSIIEISEDAPCMISNVYSMNSESEENITGTPVAQNNQPVQQNNQIIEINPPIDPSAAIGPFVVNSPPPVLVNSPPPVAINSPLGVTVNSPPPIVVSPVLISPQPDSEVPKLKNLLSKSKRKLSTTRRPSSSTSPIVIDIEDTDELSSGGKKDKLSPAPLNSAIFAFPEGATGRGQYRSRGRPPNKPGSPVEDPHDSISILVKQHIANIKEKTATIVENKEHVLQTLGPSAPGWFGKGCRVNNKKRKKSR